MKLAMVLMSLIVSVSAFADHRLGKGVVIAKDSPNFIGNHIALYGLMKILAKVACGDYTIEEVDAITGPAMKPGRPRLSSQPAKPATPIAFWSRP